MIQSLPINLLLRSIRARDRKKEDVAALAASIQEIGLLQPLCVRPSLGNIGHYSIVTGHHRHEAVMELGWDEVPCNVVTLDDLHAELAEIDENLIRAQLSPAQEAAAVARRKAIYEEIHPETKQHVAGAHGSNKAQGNASAKMAAAFTTATSRATGKSERTVERVAARGEKLGGTLKDIAGTSLDKGAELDALAKKPKKERDDLVRRAKAGEAVSARDKTVEKIPAPEGDIKPPDAMPEDEVIENFFKAIEEAGRAAGRDDSDLVERAAWRWQTSIIPLYRRMDHDQQKRFYHVLKFTMAVAHKEPGEATGKEELPSQAPALEGARKTAA